jgi:exosortase/archaeosortase family protein
MLAYLEDGSGRVSFPTPSEGNYLFGRIFRLGSLSASQFVVLALLLTLAAIEADQLAAPVVLHTSSPLWATACCLVLILRRGETSLSCGSEAFSFSLSRVRLGGFLFAHAALIFAARSLSGAIQPILGTFALSGWLLAALKLLVLAPTLLLLPLPAWKKAAQVYTPEGVAALVVLTSFLPRRTMEALWPWYGRVLGRFVFFLARPFVPALGYVDALTPTLTGHHLDVTILYACSGINGVELYDYLFAFLVVLDWNRLRKGRALFSYFAGILAMLLGNALRITSFVVFGNRGFAEIVSRLHISAGWIFFSLLFLAYLALIYRWLLIRPLPVPRNGKARPAIGVGGENNPPPHPGVSLT